MDAPTALSPEELHRLLAWERAATHAASSSASPDLVVTASTDLPTIARAVVRQLSDDQLIPLEALDSGSSTTEIAAVSGVGPGEVERGAAEARQVLATILARLDPAIRVALVGPSASPPLPAEGPAEPGPGYSSPAYLPGLLQLLISTIGAPLTAAGIGVPLRGLRQILAEVPGGPLGGGTGSAPEDDLILSRAHLFGQLVGVLSRGGVTRIEVEDFLTRACDTSIQDLAGPPRTVLEELSRVAAPGVADLRPQLIGLARREVDRLAASPPGARQAEVQRLLAAKHLAAQHVVSAPRRAHVPVRPPVPPAPPRPGP